MTTPQEFKDKVAALVALIQRDHDAYMTASGYAGQIPSYQVHSHDGNKYTRVDVGDSGKYMVVNATGEIFAIKAYGVIHRGHAFGTLDTINEWHWGGYRAVRRPKLQVTKADAGPGCVAITIGWEKGGAS